MSSLFSGLSLKMELMKMFYRHMYLIQKVSQVIT